jgi:hypothetical protein
MPDSSWLGGTGTSDNPFQLYGGQGAGSGPTSLSGSAGLGQTQANLNVGLFQVPIQAQFLNPTSTTTFDPTVYANPTVTQGPFPNSLIFGPQIGGGQSSSSSIFGGGGHGGGGGGNVSDNVNYHPTTILSSNPPNPPAMPGAPNFIGAPNMTMQQPRMMPMPAPGSPLDGMMTTRQPIAAGGVSPMMAGSSAIPQQQQLSGGQPIIPGTAAQSGGYDMPQGGANAMGMPMMTGGVSQARMAPSASPGNILTGGGGQVPTNQATAQAAPGGMPWQYDSTPDAGEGLEAEATKLSEYNEGAAPTEAQSAPSVDFKDLSTDTGFNMGMNQVIGLQKSLGSRATAPVKKLAEEMKKLGDDVDTRHAAADKRLKAEATRIEHNLQAIEKKRMDALNPQLPPQAAPLQANAQASGGHPFLRYALGVARGVGVGLGTAAGIPDPYGTPYQRYEIRRQQQADSGREQQFQQRMGFSAGLANQRTMSHNLDQLQSLALREQINNRDLQHQNDVQARDYYRYHANALLRNTQEELAALKQQGTLARNIGQEVQGKAQVAIGQQNARSGSIRAAASASQAGTSVRRENRETRMEPIVAAKDKAQTAASNAFAASQGAAESDADKISKLVSAGVPEATAKKMLDILAAPAKK